MERQLRAQALHVELRDVREHAPGAGDALDGAAEQRRVLQAGREERRQLVRDAEPEVLPERDEVAQLRVEQQVAEHREHAVAVEVPDHGDAAARGVQRLRCDHPQLALDRAVGRPQGDQPDVPRRVDELEAVAVIERLEAEGATAAVGLGASVCLRRPLHLQDCRSRASCHSAAAAACTRQLPTREIAIAALQASNAVRKLDRNPLPLVFHIPHLHRRTTTLHLMVVPREARSPVGTGARCRPAH